MSAQLLHSLQWLVPVVGVWRVNSAASVDALRRAIHCFALSLPHSAAAAAAAPLSHVYVQRRQHTLHLQEKQQQRQQQQRVYDVSSELEALFRRVQGQDVFLVQRCSEESLAVQVSLQFPNIVRAGLLTKMPLCEQSQAESIAASAVQSLNLSCRRLDDFISTAIVHLELDNGNLVVSNICIECTGVEFEAITSTANCLIDIIDQDMDIFLVDFIRKLSTAQLEDAQFSLLQYIERTPSVEGSKLLLKQQRAIIILADVLFERCFRHRGEVDVLGISSQITECPVIQHSIECQLSKVSSKEFSCCTVAPRDSDAYFEFMEPFLRASNFKELADFELCSRIMSVPPANVKFAGSFESHSGMRVGISSANASDNWTSVKLRGGVVLNFALNLLESSGDYRACEYLVACRVTRLDEPGVLVLKSKDRLSGDIKTETKEFRRNQDCSELLQWSQNDDVLRMLKYALVFCGIVRVDDNVRRQPSLILEQITEFTDGGGLSISVKNIGPSRSGFASSSAVSANVLKALFASSHQTVYSEDDIALGSMVLIFENRLGLKSGRQDVDGLLPGGIKALCYSITSGFVLPKVEILPVDLARDLPHHLALVDTGIQRGAGLGIHRGLNMRHLALLSRNPDTFPSLVASYRIHDEIVDAFRSKAFDRLGALFLQYMDAREKIDTGATASVFDNAFGGRVLKYLFSELHRRGDIFGGMLCGAMGGGVAMLVLTPGNNLSSSLQYLRSVKAGDERPFQRLQQMYYEVDVNGLQLVPLSNSH